MTIELTNDFQSRKALIDYVAELTPWLEDRRASDILGGAQAAEQRLRLIDPVGYCRSRNFLDGKVTRLSPYIRHGILTLDRVRNAALASSPSAENIEKFIQQLAWRDYWQRIYQRHPERIWHDIEEYKTGYSADDYADELPQDIACGHSGVACIDQFIQPLLKTGYMHNHTRMYVAAYVVHWRRVKWQAGAKWFLRHLLDGDPASNNLSWQWVASTFSNKPYIFNLDNVRKYAPAEINTTARDNAVLDQNYEDLTAKLFPKQRSTP
jgi:deoxyribodipyrimidine photo-lyase